MSPLSEFCHAAAEPTDRLDDGTIRARLEVAVQKYLATRLIYEDYLRFPDDGLRHEIIEGEHYVSPSPSRRPSWSPGRDEALDSIS